MGIGEPVQPDRAMTFQSTGQSLIRHSTLATV
jgi:hypothetical protein